MASATQTMTPDQALQTLAAVRDYRERLTGRAAGIVWMVWGFALALLASTDMLALSTHEAPQGDGWGVRLDSASVATMVVALGCLFAGALVTNAVWKAHAIEGGGHHRAWVTWAAVAALVVAGGAVGVAIVEVLSRISGPDAGDMNYVIIMPLVGAMAAGIIAVLQRRRVSIWPGVTAALLLVIVQLVVPLAIDIARESDLVVNIQVSTFSILTVFVATGLFYYKRG